MKVSALDEEAIYQVARRIGDDSARAAYLGQVCAGDAALRGRVERLLRAAEQEDGFLESPACALTIDVPEAAEGPGSFIGPYRLMEQIGEGGMGAVYVAEQHQPVRRKVALKVIKPGMDTKQVVARFEAERQALALMDHPNIARVFDAGTTATGRPYFVMELVRGIPITEFCDAQNLPIRERLELFVLVCRAVQHAHQKGIIHRDLKPSNILVTQHDGVPVPKVIDFGIAKATGQSLTDRTVYTAFTQLVGTPLYMSPEQVEMSGLDIDTRSDIYSLGVLLYELLTGTTPFDQEAFRKAALDELRRMIREDEPPRPSTRLSTLGESLSTVSARRSAVPRQLGLAVRGELDWIVMKALEKDRRRRYETAGEFAADVMRYLTDRPVGACPPSASYRLGKFARRYRAALTTVGLVAGALLVGLVASLVLAVRAMDAERKTTVALEQARENLAEAGRHRAYARQAVDEMYTQVAEKWLAREGGMTPLQRDFLEKALAFYERFADEQANDPEARAEAAKAAARVGEIRNQLGLSAAALESYRRALDGFRRLAVDFPDRPEYGRGVARSLHDIGRLYDSLSRTKDAEPALREAVALRERLAEAHRSPDDRADLAVSLVSLGTLFESSGRQDDGERSALRAIDLLTRLADEFPKEPRYQSLLARAESFLGHLYLWHKDRNDEARVRYRHALELDERLAKEYPTDSSYQLALAQDHFSLGDTYRATFDILRGAAEFRLVLPILEKLVADHPDRPRYRGRLAATLSNLSEELMHLGQFDEAERNSRRSLEIAEKLAAEFPDVPNYRDLVAARTSLLGVILAQRGRNREAREAFERAYEVQRKLCADYPDQSMYRHNLGAICGDEAVNYATFTGMESRDAVRALELARKAVEIQHSEPGRWKGLALAQYRTGDFEAALKTETKALELRKSDGYRYDWLLLALIHLGRGDREQARSWALQVMRTREPGGWRASEADLTRLAQESEPRLRALLPDDPEGLRTLLESELAAQRRRQGPAAPSTLRLREWLADQCAALGRYGEATALFVESRGLNADRYDPWFPLTVLTLRKGDLDGYRALCSEMLRRIDLDGTAAKNPWKIAQNPWIADGIARLCTAVPGAVDDPKKPLDLGRRAASADSQNAYFLLARGAAEFRAGGFQTAIEVLDQSLGRINEPPVRAQAKLFLAMAHHRLGHAEEARRALADADRALAEVPDKPDPVTLLRAWNWGDRTLAQILRREAGKVLDTP